MSAENILKTLDNGDLVSPDDADAQIEFAGRTWFVKSFVGNLQTGGVLMLEPEKTPEGLATASAAFIGGAVALLVAAKIDSPDLRKALHDMLDAEFDRATRAFAILAAGRGKPS